MTKTIGKYLLAIGAVAAVGFGVLFFIQYLRNAEDPEKQAQKYMDMGFHLAFNGLIFKMNLDEVIKRVPLEKILIETDCPYLTPSPVEGRNEPAYIKYVAEKIAEIKGSGYEDIAKITTENARKLFKI